MDKVIAATLAQAAVLWRLGDGDLEGLGGRRLGAGAVQHHGAPGRGADSGDAPHGDGVAGADLSRMMEAQIEWVSMVRQSIADCVELGFINGKD
jgi:hypothetical protein